VHWLILSLAAAFGLSRYRQFVGCCSYYSPLGCFWSPPHIACLRQTYDLAEINNVPKILCIFLTYAPDAASTSTPLHTTHNVQQTMDGRQITTFNQHQNYPQNTHLFNGPFSWTTQVSRYQKGKPNLDFTEARDSEWQWHQLGHMQVCISLQADSHASTPALSFLQAGCPSCRPINSVKALKALCLQYPQKCQLFYQHGTMAACQSLFTL